MSVPDRWALTLAALQGQPWPELPLLPGRRCECTNCIEVHRMLMGAFRASSQSAWKKCMHCISPFREMHSCTPAMGAFLELTIRQCSPLFKVQLAASANAMSLIYRRNSTPDTLE